MQMIIKKSITFATLLFGLSAPLCADVVEGVWKSAPDINGLVVHVRAKPCGSALCGVVERAKDRRGYDKRSSAVGKRVFWDMIKQPDGSYAGTLLEPSAHQTEAATMLVQGNALHLQKCEDASCDVVIWTRLR